MAPAELIAAAGATEHELEVAGPPRVDRVLAPGVAHRVGPFTVETIALAGHTPDGVGFRVRDAGSCWLSGDHLVDDRVSVRVRHSSPIGVTLAAADRAAPPRSADAGRVPGTARPSGPSEALELAAADLAYLTRAPAPQLAGALASSGADREEAAHRRSPAIEPSRPVRRSPPPCEPSNARVSPARRARSRLHATSARSPARRIRPPRTAERGTAAVGSAADGGDPQGRRGRARRHGRRDRAALRRGGRRHGRPRGQRRSSARRRATGSATSSRARSRRGSWSRRARDEAVGRLTLTTELDDFADCDLVIEAIVEELEPKRRALRGARPDLPARRRARDEHLRALGHRDRRRDDEARARRRHALLQSRAADAARRDRPRRADRGRAVRDRVRASASGSGRRRSAATTRPASSSTAS